MADPFSILASTVGLADVCIRAGFYLAQIREAAGKVEEDIAALTHDIDALRAVNESIAFFWRRHRSAVPPRTQTHNADWVQDTWKNVGVNLRDCQNMVEKMESMLQEIIGKEKATGVWKFEGLRKALRKVSKEGDFEKIRRQLADYRGSLHLLFTTLDFSYSVRSQDSIDNLSENVERLRFKLQSEMANLRPRLGSVDGTDDMLRDSINFAAAAASSVSINKHFHIPQPVSSLWTGRKALLDDLKRALDEFPVENNRIQKRFVLSGIAGSGKTQFSCKFAQDNRDDFWGIFWIDASSHESAKDTFSRIAKVAGVDHNVDAAKNWLSSQQRPWLLLIDNADDPKLSIEKYFPEGERGLILVTTRNPANEVHGTIGQGSYHFEKLEIDEANDLLLKAAGEHSPYKDSSRASASLITEELGCLPLALLYAGQAIRQSLCSLTTYLNYYKRNWRRIRQARSDDTDMNVYSSYEILYQSLEGRTTEEEEARDAVELLKLFAFLHYENIRVQFFIEAVNNPKLERVQERKKTDQEIKMASRPKPWTLRLKEMGLDLLEPIVRNRSRPVLPELLRSLEALTSFDDLRLLRALKELSQMSLITRHETSNSYSMHPLVHMWARERPGMSTGEQALWCEVTITVLAQCILLPPLGSTAEDEALRRDLLPHIKHVRSCQEEIRGSIAERQGNRNRFWPVFSPVFDRRQALVLAKFSLVYAQCGHCGEAEQLLLRVKNFVVPLLGLEHPRSIAVVLALSGTIWEQTRYNEAADLQAQLLQACLHSLGPIHPNTLRVKDMLGMSRCHQGRFWEAEELHKQAIAGMEKTLGAEHEDTLVAQDRLGKVLFNLFRYREARELHRKACTGLEKALGPNHLKTLSARENLALACLELGEELLKAHEMLEKVVAQRTKTLGKDRAWTLGARLNLAKVKTALGEVAEVENMLLEGIPIARTNLGENHFGTLAAYHFYGQFLVRQQRYDEAEKILINVVERQKYAHGAQKDNDHANRLIAMYHLVECYQLHGKIEEAIRDCDEILRILEMRNSIHPFRQWVRKKREELEAVESTPITREPGPNSPAEDTSPVQQDGKPVWAWCKP